MLKSNFLEIIRFQITEYLYYFNFISFLNISLVFFLNLLKHSLHFYRVEFN